MKAKKEAIGLRGGAFLPALSQKKTGDIELGKRVAMDHGQVPETPP